MQNTYIMQLHMPLVIATSKCFEMQQMMVIVPDVHLNWLHRGGTHQPNGYSETVDMLRTL